MRLLPNNQWVFGEGYGKRVPLVGSPSITYYQEPPPIAENAYGMEFFREVTGEEIRNKITPEDEWHGPIVTNAPGVNQVIVHRAGTADTPPTITGAGPTIPMGWTLFVPSTTTNNPRIWEAVSANVGGIWTSWIVRPFVTDVNPVVYLTQAAYDVLVAAGTVLVDTEYNIYD